MLTQSDVDKFSHEEIHHPDYKQHGGSALQRDRIAKVAEMCCQQHEGVLVEIGCLTGGTSRVLAPIAQKHGRKLICVDYWPSGTPYDMQEYKRCFYENVAPFGDTVVVIEDDAHAPEVVAQWSAEPAAFCFSDDGHSFLDHSIELAAMIPITTGIICVDDVELPEVRQAVTEAIMEHPEWRVIYGAGLRECWLVRNWDCGIEAHIRTL